MAALACCVFSSLAFAGPSDSLPLDITPEGVKELERQGIPYQLVDANAPGTRIDDPFTRVIYYASGPDARTGRERALKDRSPAPGNKAVEKGKKKTRVAAERPRPDSQRLTGTPLDWEQLKLPIARAAIPTEARLISPRALADAINDGIDLQLIDLRGRRYPGVTPVPADEIVPFPGALPMMPHEVERAVLSKRRWIVLIDDGNRVAQPVSERLFVQGFALVAVLDGGYPAWVAATDR